MFISEEIKNGFLNYIGWRQSYDPDNQISQSLTITDSGQYYQDIHPLVTLNNLRAIAPDFYNVTYPDWLVGTTYRIGDKVTDTADNKTYRAKRDNIGAVPNPSPNDWDYFDPFSEWLENKTKASSLNLIQNVYAQKIANKTAKNIFEQKALFDRAGNINDIITNASQIVGFEIVPIRTKGATVKIDRIGLQFSAIGDVKVYIMHTSRNIPLYELTYTRTRAKGMEWFTPDTDIYLPYVSNDVDAGGSYYIVYRQDELPLNSEAINKNRDWSKKPCTSCNNYDIEAYNLFSKYLEIHPFRVSDSVGSLELWDIENNLYTYDKNYGINIQLTVECDVTQIILENKRTFQTALGLQMAYDVINELAYNPNDTVNRKNQMMTKNELLYELNGNADDNKNSISYKLYKAIKAISVDMSKMSRACFKCSNGGIKYRTV